MVAERRLDVPPQTGERPRPRLRIVAGGPLPMVRRDALPEDTDYRDTGCDAAPSCLRCPLARCKYDEPPRPRPADAVARDREIALIRRRYGVPIKELARAYGLTRRSIFRILREQA
ncbi:MAG TPA: hypothetical protein VEZ14_09420 [Dehalococcoidia bacterium]|nr:hypothetical protein [Dehalococcoidia bacterium]